MADTKNDPDPLEDWVARAIDAYEMNGDAGLEEFFASLGSKAQPVRDQVERLRELGLLGVPTDGKLDRLDDFRVLELIGAGGMGVVYRAVQESLGREVAVKVIRPEHIYFPGARQRFRREVEIIAKLQHPGIVPIYSVGESGGVPYFAMEFLRGQTLDALLRKLDGNNPVHKNPEKLSGRDLAPDPENPGYLFSGTWEESCIRIVRQVAEAMQHAHERGVVHRDIKPSNVLVTNDGSGRVVLLDFGLAGAEALGKMTKTGARIGSLQYMSPEQTRGDGAGVGPTTDIYSLGVVLYELLTLRPAFAGKSETEIVRSIESGTPPAPREINPKISWEAETVCLTAMDAEPARRYASASDFCRDLDNVLAKRPVEARRSGFLRKSRRWIERNPAKAAAFALAAMLVVGVPTGYAWQQHNSSIEIGHERDRAERNSDRAQDAVERMLSRLGEVDLRFVPQMEPVRKAVLEDALELLEKFVADGGATDKARMQVAKAHMRLGKLKGELGRHAEAADSYARASDGYTALAARNDNDPAFRKDRIDAVLLHATEVSIAGRPDEALKLHSEFESRLAAVGARPGDAKWIAHARIEAKFLLARAQIATNKTDDAKNTLREATELAEALIPQESDADTRSVELAQAAWNEYGTLLITNFTAEGKGNEEAEAALTRTVRLAELLGNSKSGNRGHQFHLEVARNNLAGAYRRAQKWDRAAETYGQARAGLETLVAQFPDTLSYKLELATVCNQIGLLAEYQKNAPEAVAPYTRTVELLREITTKAPTEPVLWSRLAMAQVNLSSPIRFADIDAASKLVRSALDAERRAIALAPDNKVFQRDLVNHGRIVAILERQRGDHAASAQIVEEMMREFPKDPYPAQIGAIQIALGADLVNKNAEIGDEEKAALILNYAKRCIEALREAVRRGAPKPDVRRMVDLKVFRGLAPYEEFAGEAPGATK